MGAFTGNMPVGTLNVALSNFAKEFRNNALIGDQLAPRVNVPRQSFQYLIFDRSDMRLDRTTLRAKGARPQTDRMSYSAAPYFCKSHALEGDVPYEDQQYAAGLGFNEKQKLTKRLINKINLDRENYLATLVTNPSNVPNNLALTSGGSGTMWDDYASTASLPIPAVDAAKALLRQAGVQDADMRFFLSDPVATALRNHPTIIDRFKYTNPQGGITMAQLSSVFGVPCIAASAISLNNDNVASWVWGVNALLAYVQDASSQQDVSFAKTFTWTGGSDGMGNTIQGPPMTTDGYGVVEYPDPYLSSKTDWVACDWYWDIKITATETAFLFTNCVAAPTMGAIAAPGNE